MIYMRVMTAYHTDVGIHKPINEDSLCIQVAETAIGEVVFAIVCDGMGGLQKGELASSNVTRAFKEWFEADFPGLIDEPGMREMIFEQWASIIKTQNEVITKYGALNRIILGTTATVFLLIGTDQFLIVHVGDSRVYCINDSIYRLTEDQTVVNEEIKKGNLTPEEAERDSRRNVLLQCVGATPDVAPAFLSGKVNPGDLYLLCTDGFRHEISADEIACELNPREIPDESALKRVLEKLVRLNMERGERDNITALAIKLS